MILLGVVALLASCSHCDSAEEELVRNSAGDRVLSTSKACTSLGTSLESSIVYLSSSGERTVLMEYAPNGGILQTNGVDVPPASNPKATWLPDGSLEIHLDVVDTVWKQETSIRGKEIHYRIDHDISRIKAEE